jgi:hypothetical protein
MSTDIPTEITFRRSCSTNAKPTDATREDLTAMKQMVQEAKQDPFSVLKNFTLLPDDLLIETCICLHMSHQTTTDSSSRSMYKLAKELNAMKAMVKKASQDPDQSKYLRLSFFSKAA